jgi:acylglycerol lipase
MGQLVNSIDEKTDSFSAEDETNIVFRSWRAGAKSRAVVVIVPGYNAHSGSYSWVAEQLAAEQLVVYAIDLRGRGNSSGERFYVDDFSDYVSDIATLIGLVSSREPDLPLFLLGHSAGGVAACLYALDHQKVLRGLICESFAFELPAPDLALSVIKGVSHLTPHAHLLRLKNEDFSRDPEIVQAMNEDPLIAGESQPAETLAALVRANERLRGSFQQLTLPVLILHGTKDRAAKPSGSQYFYEKVGSSDKTLKLYEGGFHDLLNDLGKKDVMSDLERWIDAHIAT